MVQDDEIWVKIRGGYIIGFKNHEGDFVFTNPVDTLELSNLLSSLGFLSGLGIQNVEDMPTVVVPSEAVTPAEPQDSGGIQHRESEEAKAEAELRAKVTLSLCNCGCGQHVSKPGNRYVWGHNASSSKKEVSRQRQEVIESKILELVKGGKMDGIGTIGKLLNTIGESANSTNYTNTSSALKKLGIVFEYKTKTPLNEDAVCPECGGKNAIKCGSRKRASGGVTQRWGCKDCGTKFVTDPCSGPYSVSTKLYAVKLYESGMSLAEVVEELDKMERERPGSVGKIPDRSTIYKWSLDKDQFLAALTPNERELYDSIKINKAQIEVNRLHKSIKIGLELLGRKPKDKLGEMALDAVKVGVEKTREVLAQQPGNVPMDTTPDTECILCAKEHHEEKPLVLVGAKTGATFTVCVACRASLSEDSVKKEIEEMDEELAIAYQEEQGTQENVETSSAREKTIEEPTAHRYGNTSFSEERWGALKLRLKELMSGEQVPSSIGELIVALGLTKGGYMGQAVKDLCGAIGVQVPVGKRGRKPRHNRESADNIVEHSITMSIVDDNHRKALGAMLGPLPSPVKGELDNESLGDNVARVVRDGYVACSIRGSWVPYGSVCASCQGRVKLLKRDSFDYVVCDKTNDVVVEAGK